MKNLYVRRQMVEFIKLSKYVYFSDLGASPNYRDHRGLTPLYYCVTYAKDPLVCEALLHDYAVIGVADHQGWQETHQVMTAHT